MANWCNVRLVVAGAAVDLAAFRRAAGALQGFIDARKSEVFTPDMETGESRDLEAEGVSVFRRKFRRTSYLFQGRNTDHVEHFVKVSRRYPRLAFVLVWSDPNADSHGSHLLLKGRKRVWHVPRSVEESVLMKHYRRAGVVDANGEVDYDADEASSAEWEAFFEMMDVAQAHWDEAVVGYLTGIARRPQPTVTRVAARLS